MKQHLKELTRQATEIRKLILKMLLASLSGHPGSSLSLVEIIVTLFRYHNIGKDIRANNQLILSKGHGVPAIYAYYIHAGILPASMVSELRKGGSPLQGHPDERFFPHLNYCSGSLGINAGMAAGMAKGILKRKWGTRVFTILGDGEMQEGQVWEAFMFVSHNNLTNLTYIIDYNKLQLDGTVDSIMSLGKLADKIRAFGLQCEEVDGHDYTQLERAVRQSAGVPSCIIAHTTKGKGVPQMEGITEWHSIHDPELARTVISEVLENQF